MTAADALDVLDQLVGIAPAMLSEIRSAVRALTKATGRQPTDISLAPKDLVPLLKSLHPARHRWSGKRWANLRSALKTLAIETGHAISERSLAIDTGGP